VPIADADLGLGMRASWHGMAVDQERFAVQYSKLGKLIGQCLVKRAMHVIDPALQIFAADRPPPQCPVAMGAGGDQSKTVPSPRPNRSSGNVEDGGRIDLFFIPVAVDHRPGHRLDDGSESRGNRAPHKAVDQRIFQSLERAPALGRVGKHRWVILSPRMGHGQQDRQAVAGRVDDRAGILLHGNGFQLKRAKCGQQSLEAMLGAGKS
jgi:hypothetical protein